MYCQTIQEAYRLCEMCCLQDTAALMTLPDRCAPSVRSPRRNIMSEFGKGDENGSGGLDRDEFTVVLKNVPPRLVRVV